MSTEKQSAERFPGESSLNILHAFVQEQVNGMRPFQAEATRHLLEPAFQYLGKILTSHLDKSEPEVSE